MYPFILVCSTEVGLVSKLERGRTMDSSLAFLGMRILLRRGHVESIESAVAVPLRPSEIKRRMENGNPTEMNSIPMDGAR